MNTFLLLLSLTLGQPAPDAAPAAAPVRGTNVDLTTLPQRSSVQLTIYNSVDLTLVRETRLVTFKKGANRLQFSWANTLIDPSSVEFRVLKNADQIDVADTTFPGKKPQHLIWNVQSKIEGQVPVEVTYFTSGLSWQMDYVAITDPDEATMQFNGYVTVSNRSGEEYEHAQIRLIVGTINLVEKIADLARQRGIVVHEEAEKLGLEDDKYQALRRDAGRLAEKSAGMAKDGKGEGGGRFAQGIVKEGLSEYFLFSVEGTETIPNGWSKRMRAVKADAVKFDTVYRMRAYQYGPRPVKFYTWRNDAEHKLGDSPLPDGLVRTFHENGRDGLSFLGQQQVRYVPIKAEIEVNLGADDLVVYETSRAALERVNFHFRNQPNFRPVPVPAGDPKREFVDGWDERAQWVDTIKNYHSKPIKFELRRLWPGDIEFQSATPTKPFDYRTAETTVTVPALDKTLYPASVTTHFGVNQKQQRIKLKP